MDPSNHASQAKIFVKYCNIGTGKSIVARQHLRHINAYVTFVNLFPSLYEHLSSLWSAHWYMYFKKIVRLVVKHAHWGSSQSERSIDTT